MFWGYQAPRIQTLLNKLGETNDLIWCEPLKLALISSIRDKFVNYLCPRDLVATLLHPRFKKALVEANFPTANITQLEHKIVHEMDRMQFHAPSFPTSRTQAQNVSINGNSVENALLVDIFGEVEDRNLTASADEQDSKALLNKYFLEADKTLLILHQRQYAKVKRLFIK